MATTTLRSRTLAAVLGVLSLAIPLVLLILGSGPKKAVAPAAGRAPAAASGRTCDVEASGVADLAMRFSAATSGQTVCLAPGDYGTFRGGQKEGLVTVRARPDAKVKMALDLNSTVNVRIENVTIPSAVIQGTVHNVTIAHSRFTGIAVVHAAQMANAHLVFDRNRHANIDTCRSCYQGRLHIEGSSGKPSGIVVKNSVFSGGNSDGVRPDSYGVQVIDNEFYGLRDQDPFHTDPIQLYGGSHVVIRGNYFHDNEVSAEIMMADGGDHNVVEDNVVAGTGYTWAMTWYSDNGSLIRHNTFADGACKFGVRCGIINVGAKAADPSGHGTRIRDNVMGGISNGGGDKNSSFIADHNLSATPAPGSVAGVPSYRGPGDSYAGHRLARGSRGSNDASDGKDLGIR